jgi:hypothetical protein
MSIAFKFRNIGGGYLGASVSVGGGSFDLGLLSESERESLASDLRSAADDLFRLDAQQTEAYAEGRADERAEWLPVLEALRTLATYFPTDSDMLDLDWGKDYIDAACNAYAAALAAIAKVEAP